MLAVIGAMREEIDLIEAAMTVSKRKTHAGIETVRGGFQGVEIVLAQCGVGKVNATICTQMLIDHYRPGALLFSGVADGLLPNMRAGDVVKDGFSCGWDVSGRARCGAGSGIIKCRV